MTPAPASLPGAAAVGTLVGPYRLVRLLGQGGMATVYEARHESLGRTVALKLVRDDIRNDEFVRRFRSEGFSQAVLEHPHVVRVYEAGESHHGPYLAMQLVRGPTMADLIDASSLDARRALHLLGQVAGALDAAHAAGLVHRDLKPRNLLVGKGDHAYLADFGVAMFNDSSGFTATGQLVGTLAYLGPELIRGEPATPASDRYAFAAVLFECLTGTVVFPRPTPLAMLYAHTNDPPPSASRRRADLPAALDEVLSEGLAKDPAMRPASATALVQRVAGALAGGIYGAPTADTANVVRSADSTLDTITGPAPTTGKVASVSPTSADASPPATTPRATTRRRGIVAIAALSGALVGAVLAGSAVAALRRESAALALEAGPAGAVAMGSDLERAGGALDCAGAAVTPGGRGCSLFQKRLGDATLVVPQNGVVRRWAVRSSIGELALAVLRRRGSGYFQVARSRNEFVTDAGVHTFAADLAVDQGDRLALVVVAGSGAGVRPAGGATTGRWTSGRAPAASGPAGELLLHVDVLPGVTQSVPPQVVGTGADKLPEGDVISRAIVRLGSGAQAEVVLLTVAGHGALDLRRDGRRFARIDVTDMPPKGVTLIEMTADADPSGPEALTINLEFVHTQSDRVVRHYYTADEHGFEFVD